jgi:hypothetical protein
MSRLDGEVARDIGLWLAGEATDGEVGRAVKAIETSPEARDAMAAQVAIEDVVRAWYGGLPLPPPPPQVVACRRRRAIVSTWLAAVAAGIAVLMLAHGDGRPMERALDVTASWLTAGPKRPVDASSWWQLRRDADGR